MDDCSVIWLDGSLDEWITKDGWKNGPVNEQLS